ncbi:mitochondrial ornithine transporter 1-like [Spea bombifrons]|uniref:mitochondrial ornithine transporter 1-like n=1 Tax=Spea bombifrons TaxID=233779 RepID=UPI0023498DE9|nr:mitochondrial ornithine transporter 1-like [Spea bombifrons]
MAMIAAQRETAAPTEVYKRHQKISHVTHTKPADDPRSVPYLAGACSHLSQHYYVSRLSPVIFTQANMSEDKNNSSHLMQALINLTAGAMGGVACVVSGQPFDTAKVKMQAFPSIYRGFLDCAVRTYNTEGLRGLYHGTTPALVANVAENAVLFACYGFCQNIVAQALGLRDTSQLSDWHKAASGSLASVFSSLVLCPTELVKCRMQTQHEMRMSGYIGVPGKSGPWSVVRAILSSDGVPGLFRGLSSTWLREIPGYFFFFGGYELSNSILTRRQTSDKTPGALVVTISGGIGGACFWLAVYPVDSVKSRIQVLSLASRQEGFILSLLHILRTEGVLTLYSGLMPTVVRAFPSNAALFLAYEMTKRTLTKCLYSSN